MNVVLQSAKCDPNLPVWAVDSSLELTCNESKTCRFSEGNSALVSGKIMFYGFENYAEDDTMVALVGGFDTISDRYVIDEVVDLCQLNYNTNSNNNNQGNDDFYDGDDARANNDDAANNDDDDGAQNDDDGNYNDDDGNYNNDDAANDDDAYNADDDANRMLDENNDDENNDDCPADGMYEFSASFRLPDAPWSATGWGANADLQMYAHDGSLLASCEMTFKTQTTAFYIVSAKALVITLTVAAGGALFLLVYFFIKREMLCKLVPSDKSMSVGDSSTNRDYKSMGDADFSESGANYPPSVFLVDNDEASTANQSSSWFPHSIAQHVRDYGASIGLMAKVRSSPAREQHIIPPSNQGNKEFDEEDSVITILQGNNKEFDEDDSGITILQQGNKEFDEDDSGITSTILAIRRL